MAFEDDMKNAVKELRDNQIVQGVRLHRAEDRLDRIEEMVERNSQAIAKLADGMILIQAAMKGLISTVDRFISGMEHNGHHPSDGGPEERR